MACNRCICFCYFPFWEMLCPFTPLTAQKMKIFLKSKKYLDTLSFNKSVPEIMIICFTVPEIWYMTDLIVIFHFVLLFALLPLAFFILNTILSFYLPLLQNDNFSECAIRDTGKYICTPDIPLIQHAIF